MHFIIELLKALLLFFALTYLPLLIFTGGTLPEVVVNNPIFHFYVFFVLAYTIGPRIAHMFGHHAGLMLFHSNKANFDKPTMSHIISLRNKRLYREAEEELRLLIEQYPEDIEPYKMLLHLTAHELPDRSLFDLTYRKGKKSLPTDELKAKLKEYRDEHIQHKKSKNEEWDQSSHKNSSNSSKEQKSNVKDHEKYDAKKVDREVNVPTPTLDTPEETTATAIESNEEVIIETNESHLTSEHNETVERSKNRTGRTGKFRLNRSKLRASSIHSSKN